MNRSIGLERFPQIVFIDEINKRAVMRIGYSHRNRVLPISLAHSSQASVFLKIWES